MSLFSNTMLICFFDLFSFSLIFFHSDPKNLKIQSNCFLKFIIFFLGVRNEKNQLWCRYFQIRFSNVSFDMFTFSLIFFVLTPKSINNSEFGLKKLTLSSFGLKTKKNNSDVFIFKYDAHMFFWCVLVFVDFFFVLTPKSEDIVQLFLKIYHFHSWGQKRKKNRHWSCYFCHTVFYFYKCSCFFSYFLYLKQICRCICTFLVACGQVIVRVIGAFSIWV